MIPDVVNIYAIFILRHLACITFKGGQLYTDKCQGWEGSERPWSVYNTCTVRLLPSVGVRCVNKVDILRKMWCMSCIVCVCIYVCVCVSNCRCGNSMSLHHRVVNTQGIKSFLSVHCDCIFAFVDPPTGVAACDQSFSLWKW